VIFRPTLCTTQGLMMLQPVPLGTAPHLTHTRAMVGCLPRHHRLPSSSMHKAIVCLMQQELLYARQ
jgi:hypothetical protein